MSHIPALTPDCSQCAALCCVGLAFDQGAYFAIDKPAGTPCPHLGRHECTIHADLLDRGFPGCIVYGCTGAGQRVVQEIFNGQSWRDRPELLPDMLRCFADVRQIHTLLELLTAAEKLPLPDDLRAERAALEAELTPPDLDAPTAARLAEGPLSAQVHVFLRSLAPLI